jgi:hypothetical protein
MTTGVTQFVDWNGDAAYSTALTLEGDQCLVFFLGGIPVHPGTGVIPGTQGFSRNPLNPTDTTAGTRIGPFYDFQSSRLVDLGHPSVGGSSTGIGYYSYADPFGQPYLYFSSYKAANGYNRFASLTTPNKSDCDSSGVWAYAVAGPTAGPPVRYQNANTFQIISAGPNRAFGPGTDLTQSSLMYWTADTAGDRYAEGSNGADDISNFHEKPLGTTVVNR